MASRSRLGFGGEALPTTVPGEANPTAQRLFLEAVDAHTPKCLESLATIAPDVYQPPRGSGHVAKNTTDDSVWRTWAETWGFACPDFPELRITWNPIEQPEEGFRAVVDA